MSDQPASGIEAPLEPDLEICDPHHHLWEYPGSVYLIDELRADGAGRRIASTVFVECGSAYRPDGPDSMKPVGETEWVASLRASPVAAIVSFADLTLGAAIADVLDAHAAVGDGRFRGIRHVSAFDADDRIRASHTNPPPGLLGLPSFREGYAELGRAGLSFDAWQYFPQLPELVDLARAHPEVPIILDHLGGPIGIGPYEGRREENLATWRAAMAEVTSCDNVVLKLGGIGMPIFGLDWHKRSQQPSSGEVAAAWGDPIRWCIDMFGPTRCMFESNFPVDRASVSYGGLWNAFVRIASGYTAAEKRDLFHDTAVRTYGIS
jgi:predicted TIM-barrel fold metal-dependent hydrolase